MSSFPVLKNRPIDQWKVTELKDELRKRKLPVKGLKEELVRRLFDSIQTEAASDESAEDVGANEAVDEGAKDVEANAPVDKDVEMNEPVDQAPEKHTVSEKTTVSATEVYQETVVQEITLPLPEVSQDVMALSVEDPPRDDNLVATHESLSTEAPTEKGDGPSVVEETPNVGTNETIVVNDVTTTDLKSDLTSSEVKSDDATEASKTDEHDKVPDADPMDTDVAAASLNNDAERIVPNSDMNNNATANNEECKDSELMNEDSKPIVSKSNNQN